MGRFFKRISVIIVSLAIILSSMSLNVLAEEKQSKASNQVYLVVNSKTNNMGYYKNGELVREFRVSTGTKREPTPNGKHKIVNKIVNRPYYKGGIPGGSPKNPLGNRWMGLHIGYTYGTTYGVHGNNNENSIGKNVTEGCIRMHNKEIRWLFDQIETGAYVIVDNSNESYTEIAAKYGVVLNSRTENIKKLDIEFNKFTKYNNINLLDTNSLISKSDDATKILQSSSSYVNAYNKLSSTEKENQQVKNIHSKYNKIISVVEGAQAVLKFYEHVSANSNNLIYNPEWSAKLNSTSSQEFGTRGKAQKQLNEAAAYESTVSSKRISHLNSLYDDCVNFLYTSEAIGAKDISTAKSKSAQIKDTNLKKIATWVVSNQSDIDAHWAEFNIKEAMNNGWIATTKNFRPEDSITRAEFVKVINRAFGFTEGTEVDLSDVSSNKWYYSEIAIAINQGYIAGYDDNTFRPDTNITREEVAKVITYIMKNSDENIDKIINYIDCNMISDWAITSVEGAIEAGYMGSGGVEFRPKDKITRAEAVVTIQRAK